MMEVREEERRTRIVDSVIYLGQLVGKPAMPGAGQRRSVRNVYRGGSTTDTCCEFQRQGLELSAELATYGTYGTAMATAQSAPSAMIGPVFLAIFDDPGGPRA